MVLAVIVAEVVNRTLGCYVQNLNSKQLQFAFLGGRKESKILCLLFYNLFPLFIGEVVLNDLLLKPTALDGLNLPIQVVHGVLGKFLFFVQFKS